MQCLEAVNHDKPRAAFLEYRGDLLGNAGKAAGAYHSPEILIENIFTDRSPVEEVQVLAEANDLLQRLRDRREIDRRTLRSRVLEDVLLRDNRLAGSRQARDEADRVRGQPSPQDHIERPMPAQKPVTHDRPPAPGQGTHSTRGDP